MTGKIKSRAYKAKSRVKQPSYWAIVVVIMIFLLVGVIVKGVFFSRQVLRNDSVTYEIASKEDKSLEPQVLVVASNFTCACGGCGELPLIECQCTMPRGALEEKEFIRNKLTEGLSVGQVIRLVDEVYGNKIA